MDKNTPFSVPSSEHEMEPKGKHKSSKKVDVSPAEPSIQVIKNIQAYSKALNIKPTKGALQFVEYITN